MEAKAYLTKEIHPDVVQLPSHWEAKHNVNAVMDNEYCAPHVGSTPSYAVNCPGKEKVSPRPKGRKEDSRLLWGEGKHFPGQGL